MKEGREIFVIITAAGSGTRMGGPLPKQFMPLNGVPVLRRTIDAFRAVRKDISIILVLPPDQKEWWLDYCRSSSYYIGPHKLVSGGITRYHSVKNALAYVPDGAIVAIHDGVRPFPAADMLGELFGRAVNEPALCPAVASVDTLRILSGDSASGKLVCESQLDRNRIYAVQTPQVFHSELLRQAYTQPFSDKFTDDASVVESYGTPVTYTRGSRFNIKLTTPDDMVLAEAIVSATTSSSRL